MTVDINKKYSEQIRQCGQSLIDNAEKIAADFKYRTGGIDITIAIRGRELPLIKISETIYPEKIIDEYIKSNGGLMEKDIEVEPNNN